MQIRLRTAAVAVSAFACAALFSFGWSDGGGVSLSIDKAQAYHRVYVGRHVNPYYTNEGLPWDAVRAYYFGGPWSGVGPAGPYSWTGWSDYAARNGISCTPGTVIKGGDGILYLCQ